MQVTSDNMGKLAESNLFYKKYGLYKIHYIFLRLKCKFKKTPYLGSWHAIANTADSVQVTNNGSIRRLVILRILLVSFL